MSNPELTIVRGSVTARRQDTTGRFIRFETDAPSSPGSCGGLVLNRSGIFLGVIDRAASARGTTRATEASVVQDFLSREAFKVSFSPSRMPTPPGPVVVTVRPVFVELSARDSWVRIEGNGIIPKSVPLEIAPNGVRATLPAPLLFDEQKPPDRYLVSVIVSVEESREPVRRRFALKVGPEATKAPGVEGRSDGSPASSTSGSTPTAKGGTRLSNVAESVKLTSDRKLDNSAIHEMGSITLDPQLFNRLPRDLRKPASEFERVRREIAALDELLRNQPGGRLNDYATKIWHRVNKLGEVRREKEEALRGHMVARCEESGVYFILDYKHKDDYPCGDWIRY